MGLSLSGSGSPGVHGSASVEAEFASLASPSRAGSEEAPPRSFGDYELLDEIAHGGMGVVYRARELSLNRIVALKMLLFGKFASESFVNRFRLEAQAAARLQHPNIVAIHEIGQHQGQHYFTMDYVEGKDLSQICHDGPLPVMRAAKYAQGIAEAIHYAHTRGVLHRDLKPSNVLIDANDQPHITDFGLAKQLSEVESSTPNAPLTATGQVLGSPAFLPPEQAGQRRVEVGPASDVYSLGALLYSLVCGRPPFTGESLEAILTQVLQSDPVALRLLNPSVPRDVQTICLKCLEKDPRRRYDSAKALADDLTCFLSGEPITARPLNRIQKAARWCQRQPAVAALVASLAGLLLAGTSLVVWQWRQAASEAEQKRHLLYVSDTSVGYSQWKEGNLLPVLAALERHIPGRGETDLRGFEWRHLWWLAHHGPRATIPARNQAAGAMAFSPNGKILAVYYWDEVLRFWDLDTPDSELHTIPNAATLGGFLAGGEEYLVGCRDGSITIRRTKTGEILRTVATEGDLVAVAGNGQSLALIDSNHLLKVVDVATGRVRFVHSGPVRRRSDYSWGALVALSFDGKFLALANPGKGLAHSDDSVEVWNTEANEQVPCSLPPAQVRCLLFAPGGRALAVGNGDGTVQLWDLATNISRRFGEKGLPVLSLELSPDGRTLAVGGADETIRFWDVATGAPALQAHKGSVGQVWALAFSPDGETLASGSRDTPIKLWALHDNVAPDSIEQLAVHEEWGNFTFSPDSKLMAAACRGSIIKVWDVATFELVASLPGAAYVVAFSNQGHSLLVSTGDGIPFWWDFRRNRRMPIRNHSMTGVRCVDLSPARRLAALGYENGTIELLELDSDKPAVPWRAHADAVQSIKFSPSGDQLLSGCRDRSIALWEVATHKQLTSNDPGEHRGAVCALAYSRDGKMFASGCGADLIKVWDASRLAKAIASMPYHKATIRSLDFSPDGTTLASGSDDGTVRLSRLGNVPRSFDIAAFPMGSPVRLVLFSPDGNTLAAVTDGGTLRLFRADAIDQ